MFDLYDAFKKQSVPEKYIIRKYESLEPATTEWMQVWRKHPYLQKQMLEYAKKKYHHCRIRDQRVAFVVCFNKKCDCLQEIHNE